jgi:hypothetical protein
MSKNICIFKYCNYGKGYFEVRIPKTKDEPASEITIELDDYLLENGVIKNIDSIADKIKEKINFKKKLPVVLLLRCEETYKTILSLPMMNKYKAKSLYRKEQKAKKVNNSYVKKSNYFQHSLGYIFNTYYMPKDVINSFKKLAKMLGTRIISVEPFGFYLKKLLPYENYVYFYIRRKVCTLFLVVNKELVSVYDFEFKTKKDIVNQFLLVMSKHEFEFERKLIQYYGIDSDEKITLDLGLEKLEDKKISEEVYIEEEPDNSTFLKRHDLSSKAIKKRYKSLFDRLLAYENMSYKITDNSVIFYIEENIYAQLDIRKGRVDLYLALDPEKYPKLYKAQEGNEKGFETTPCLLSVSSKFKELKAKVLIKKLANTYDLVSRKE